jgi:hypothetical protein
MKKPKKKKTCSKPTLPCPCCGQECEEGQYCEVTVEAVESEEQTR